MPKTVPVTVRVLDLDEVKHLIARITSERDEARQEAEHWEGEYWRLLGASGGVSSP